MNYGLNAGVLQQVKIVLLAPSPHDYLTKTGGPGTQFANPLLEMLGRVASSSKTLPNIEFTLPEMFPDICPRYRSSANGTNWRESRLLLHEPETASDLKM